MAIRFSTCSTGHHHHRHHHQNDPCAAAKNPGGLYFVLGMFTLFGLIFAGIGLGIFFKGEATKSWVPAEGRVVSSAVSSHRDSDGDTMYSASVLYEYEYQGKSYKSSKVGAVSTSSSDYGAAQRTVDSYFVGKEIKVFVNPADPYSAVLQTGGGWLPLIFVAFGGVFAAIGILGLINAPKTIAEAKARMEEDESRRVAAANPPEDLLGKL